MDNFFNPGNMIPPPKLKLVDNRTVWTCPICRSPDVAMDAAVKWDVEQQEWVLAAISESGTCSSCGHETDKLVEQTVNSLDSVQLAFINREIDVYTPVL